MLLYAVSLNSLYFNLLICRISNYSHLTGIWGGFNEWIYKRLSKCLACSKYSRNQKASKIGTHSLHITLLQYEGTRMPLSLLIDGNGGKKRWIQQREEPEPRVSTSSLPTGLHSPTSLKSLPVWGHFTKLNTLTSITCYQHLAAWWRGLMRHCL